MRRRITTLCSLGLTIAMLAVSAEAQTITQVMSRLDSPRGVAFGPDGGLYVTEAGVPANSGFCVVGAANGGQVLNDGGRIRAALPRVPHQGQAMRAGVLLNAGSRCDERLHDVQLSHIAAEKIVGRAPCASRNSAIGLLPTSGCGIDARFPIAESPVDGRTRERGLTFDQFLHAFQVAMRHADGLFHQHGILRWKHVVRQ